MKNNLFILGYNGSDYFDSWYDREQFQNTKLYYFDNGQQSLSNILKKDCVHITEKNIGCAGGWNLICDIGFDSMKLEKIVIGNEDAMISEEILDELYKKCEPSVLCGTYDNNWEFSSFCIHRDTFKKVGRFDENIIFVGCEDDDYKYRCKLNNIKIDNLGVSYKYNISIANNDKTKPRETSIYNGEYVKEKWGNNTYIIPFNDSSYIHKPTKMIKKYYGDIKEWLSEVEYKKFKNK